MTNEDRLDEIRKKKLNELKEQKQNEQSQEEKIQEKNKEEALDHLMRKILTPEARKRVKNVKLADEEKAEKVEKYLLKLAQSGKLSNKVTESQIKDILKEFTEDKSFNIKGMRSRKE